MTAPATSKSSLIAVKTVLAERTVLLSPADAPEYQRNAQEYLDAYKPVGLRECELVQSLSETTWRLQRIPGLEMAIYALGSMEFAGAFDQHAPALRPGMIELQTFLKYQKQLRSLQLQEARLQRRYEKESAELHNLQRDRTRKDEAAARSSDLKNKKEQAKPENPAAILGKPGVQPSNGFEFSTAPKRSFDNLP